MKRAGRKGATLADVARISGVSVATASKVLNDRPGIADATRAAVERAIVEVGYAPTVAPARSQRNSSARPVVAIFDTLTNIYSQHVLEGVLDAARQAGVPVQVSNLGNREAPPDFTDRTWLEATLSVNPIALVAVTTRIDTDLIERVKGASLPLVAVDPQLLTDDSIPSVGATNWAGGMQATEHLLGLGHRRIGFIGASPVLLDFQERLGGWRQALTSAGLSVDEELIVECAADFAGGDEATARLLSFPDPPTAVVATQDMAAIGAISQARRQGLQVPDDFSVVGYDDTYAELWPDPPLTSVRLPLHEIGSMALRTAADMARGVAPASTHIQLATSLVLRNSTAAPREER